MLILPRSVRVSGPRGCAIAVATTSSVGSLPLDSSVGRRRRLSDGKIHLAVAVGTLGTACAGGVYRSRC
jgi:hypothetical protein